VKIFVVGEGGAGADRRALQRLRAGQSVAGLPAWPSTREGQATFADPPPPVSAAGLAPPPDYRGFDLSRYSAPALMSVVARLHGRLRFLQHPAILAPLPGETGRDGS
jgi:hypothetical protein